MKRTLLSLAAGLLLASGTMAQNTSIFESGQAVNLSGTVFNYDLTAAATNEHMVDFIVNNLSQTGEPWIITRRILTQPATWSNYFCWGVTGQIGNCYPTSTNEFFDSDAFTIPAGGSGVLSTYVTSTESGTSTYRYYVSTDGTNFIDSVDILVSSSVGIEEITPSLTVNVAPNPASDYVKVTAQGVNQASIRIIDVLGNVIMTSTINESKTIDVSEFRNGIYFILVESAGVKAVNRKVIVRH